MAQGSTPLLLIVDDDRVHRLMLATLLEEWGYRAEEAGDGLEALSFVQANRVGLVLMDIRMPGMDGLEATRRIREMASPVPVVVMTAYSSISTAKEAVESGAFDYVTKPLDFEVLKGVVQRGLAFSSVGDSEKREASEAEAGSAGGDMWSMKSPVCGIRDSI